MLEKLQKIRDVLCQYTCSSFDEGNGVWEDYNNDEVIAAISLLDQVVIEIKEKQ